MTIIIDIHPPVLVKFASKLIAMPTHDPEDLFQDKIDKEVKIEPKDWMAGGLSQNQYPSDQSACPQ